MKQLSDYIGSTSSEDLGKKLLVRIYRVWLDNWAMYHNGPPGGQSGSFYDSFELTGPNDEILSIRINDMRNLITHMLNLVYARPPALKAIAQSASPESMQAAAIADSLLQDDFKAKNGGRYLRRAGEWALVQGVGFVAVEWDTFAGQPFVPDGNGDFIRTGGLRIRDYAAPEVVFDTSKRVWADNEWVILPDRANRYVLASQFTDKADEIMRQPSIAKDNRYIPLFSLDEETDDILLVKFFHRPVNSKFLPDGRYSLSLEDGTILADGENPYSDLHDGKLCVFPVTSSQGLGSVYAHPMASDISPMSRLKNLVATIAATKVAAFGAGTIVGPPLSQLEPAHLIGGMKYLQSDAGQKLPQALNLLEGLKDLFEVMNFATKSEEMISGMNAVVRGDVTGDRMSGKAIAAVKSMAIQFMSSFQLSAIESFEEAGNLGIALRRKFTPGTQIATITGEQNIQQIEQWTSATLHQIARVRAEAVDPSAQTQEWRDEFAEFLITNGRISTPAEINLVRETGRLEPLTRADSSQLHLIQRENSKMRNGEMPIVLEDDKHEIHIPDHSSLTADPDVRENAASIQNVIEHNAMHKLFVMGIPPIQGPGAPPAMQQLEQAKAQMQAQAQMQVQAQQGPPEQQGGQQKPMPPPSSGSVEEAMTQPSMPGGLPQ
jgi:hypothetical protein